MIQKLVLNLYTANNSSDLTPILHIEPHFYTFGGSGLNSLDRNKIKFFKDSENASNVIGRMDMQGQWTKIGELNEARRAPNAIFDGTSIIVVGGQGNFQTEICSFDNVGISCTSQAPELKKYAYYPELFLVSDSFCKQ